MLILNIMIKEKKKKEFLKLKNLEKIILKNYQISMNQKYPFFKRLFNKEKIKINNILNIKNEYNKLNIFIINKL